MSSIWSGFERLLFKSHTHGTTMTDYSIVHLEYVANDKGLALGAVVGHATTTY